MSGLGLDLIGFAVLLILSAFFSSAEVAYTGLTRTQIDRLKRVKPDGLRLWESRPDRVLAALLLSNNAVNTGVGVLAGSLALHVAFLRRGRPAVITFVFGLASGIIVLVFGEILPKVWAKRFSLGWAIRVTPVMNLWCRMVNPLATCSSGSPTCSCLVFRAGAGSRPLCRSRN
jgi:CBS domain containing-hemolysin-like protein